MNNGLNDLYSELIRKHNDQPIAFGVPKFLSESVQAYNPVCGDKFTLYLSKEKNPLFHLAFQGFGCAISKASASMMIELIQGKSTAEARALGILFIQFLRGENVQIPETLHAFYGIRKYPERFECAALPWMALEKYFATHTPS
jgi:nitrogen fixation NifU-like protein